MKKEKNNKKEIPKIKLKKTKNPVVSKHINRKEPDLWKEISSKFQPIIKTYTEYKKKRKIEKIKEEQRKIKMEEKQRLKEEGAQRLMEQEERKLKKEKRLKAQEERKLKKEKRLKEKNQFGKNIAIIFSFAAQFIIGFIIAVFIVLIIIYAIF